MSALRFGRLSVMQSLSLLAACEDFPNLPTLYAPTLRHAHSPAPRFLSCRSAALCLCICGSISKFKVQSSEFRVQCSIFLSSIFLSLHDSVPPANFLKAAASRTSPDRTWTDTSMPDSCL